MDVVQGGIYFYEPPKCSDSDQAALLTTSGSEQSGWRPWVIVSHDDINSKHRKTAIGVPLTSKLEKANAYRIQIPAAEIIPEYPNGPFTTSVALCDHVRVLNTEQIRAKAGHVSENALRSIGVGLAYVFDIR